MKVPQLTGFSFNDKISPRSKRELFIEEYINSLGILCFHSNKDNNPTDYELDLYCPQLKIAFDYNGFLFHHSYTGTEVFSGSKPKTYHKDKTDACLFHEIKLYHLWEHLSDDFIKQFICYVLNQENSNFKIASLLNTLFVTNKQEKKLYLDRDYFPDEESIKNFLVKVDFKSQIRKLEAPIRIWFFTKTVKINDKKYSTGEILSDYAYRKLKISTEGYGIVPIYNSGVWVVTMCF